MPFDPPSQGCLCEMCTDTPAPTYTEQFRHECEVRWVASMPLERAVNYLVGVIKKRSEQAGERILRDLPRKMMQDIADYRKFAPDGIQTPREAATRSSDEEAYFGEPGGSVRGDAGALSRGRSKAQGFQAGGDVPPQIEEEGG